MSYFITKMVSSEGPDGDTEFWTDYLNNPIKSFSYLSEPRMPSSYWFNYDLVYDEYVALGDLKFRGKYVVGNVLTVISIWNSEESRTNFEADVNVDAYMSAQLFPWDSVTNEPIDLETAQSEIQTLLASDNYVIRDCADELITTGMVLGDTLHDQPLTEVF